MVKNGPLARIFLMLQGLFCAQFRALWAAMVKNCWLASSSPARTVLRLVMGQEQPAGLYLPHRAKKVRQWSTLNRLWLCFHHNMLKPHYRSLPLQVAEGGNRAHSLLPPPAVGQIRALNARDDLIMVPLNDFNSNYTRLPNVVYLQEGVACLNPGPRDQATMCLGRKKGLPADLNTKPSESGCKSGTNMNPAALNGHGELQ
ncbi:hypothetical protein C8F04DRAFT_1190414 [Mycena alexandri]|uniref:Uncharacterized protein n=1 Tax=Mycena alexandri TaxID=1745969 RepID=A0AAD6WVV0_9AGAR|nr:hypothetical protein C8F04DRAFT_1190414 [Mycena alexandri]